MRLLRVRIQNFRCIADLTLELDDVTVLVGANGTGKSSALRAIGWFFEGGNLDIADVAGHDEASTVIVAATFGEFTDADREALGSYVIDEEATFTRRWSAGEGEKLTGRGLAYPPFEQVRAHERASERGAAYRELRDARPDLELPTARSAQAADDAMREWELAHPDQLESSTVSATHLFGFAGAARLAGRFDFVLVAAVRDPESEARDNRGTLLRQLLDRSIGEQEGMRERLRELELDVSERMHTIVREEGEDALRSLSESVTRELTALVPGASVQLEARPPAFQAPPVGVDLRVADSGLTTDLGRQGHGLQRALMIALVQQLALLPGGRPDDGGGGEPDPDPAGLMLAIEEPELYQHPLQARHFAATLSALAGSQRGTIQVAYATHSEHFVDPSRYERLRRFRKQAEGAPWPSARLTHATVARVAARLQGLVPAEQVDVRIRITLRRALAEAVFAKGVVIVEGYTDAGFLQGIADRRAGFDAAGIAVVTGHGKRQLLIPWAILTELGVPTYVVFDGDSGLADRMRREGRPEDNIAAADRTRRDDNRLVLAALGGQPHETPATTIASTYTVFHDTIETEWRAWDGFTERLDAVVSELGDFRAKSEDAYRRAAYEIPTEPPLVFEQLLEAVLAVARR